MSFKRKPKEQLTMFPCVVCGKRLNATEYNQGEKCGSCISIEKGIVPIVFQQGQTIEDAKVLQMLAQWKLQGTAMALDYKVVNYCGIEYTVSIEAVKGCKEPLATIRLKQQIVYGNKTGTKEGIEVFEYCKLNNLVKSNVL